MSSDIDTSSVEALTRYEDKREVAELSDCPYRSPTERELTTISERCQNLTYSSKIVTKTLP